MMTFDEWRSLPPWRRVALAWQHTTRRNGRIGVGLTAHALAYICRVPPAQMLEELLADPVANAAICGEVRATVWTPSSYGHGYKQPAAVKQAMADVRDHPTAGGWYRGRPIKRHRQHLAMLRAAARGERMPWLLEAR